MNMVDGNENSPVEMSGSEKVQSIMNQMTEQAQAQAQVPTEQKIINQPATVDLGFTKDDSNYWYVEDLPTRYKLYPEGTRIEARPLRVIDVKKLTSITEFNVDSVINDILKRCIRGIDVNDIYVSDKVYLVFWLRANSFRDNEYVVDYYCDKCKKDSTYHFEIKNIEINYLDEVSNSVVLKDDSLVFDFLTIGDETSIDNFNLRYGDVFSKQDEEIDEDLLSLSFMIKTINNKPLSELDRYNYVLGLTAQDYSVLTSNIFKNSVGIKESMMVECQLCGGNSRIGVTFRPDFFLPEIRA